MPGAAERGWTQPVNRVWMPANVREDDMAIEQNVAIGAVAALLGTLMTELRNGGIISDSQLRNAVQRAYNMHNDPNQKAGAKEMYETMFGGLTL